MDTIKPEHENAAKAISPVCMLETNKGTVAFVTGWPPIKREKTSVPVYCLPPGEPHIIPQAQDAQETCGYAKGHDKPENVSPTQMAGYKSTKNGTRGKARVGESRNYANLPAANFHGER